MSAAQNPPAVGMGSYQQEKQLEQYIAGSDKENVFTTSNILQSMKIYNDFATAAQITSGPGSLVPEMKMIWESEAKWLKRSAQALANDGALREKFGSGWESTTALAPILKQLHAEQTLKETLSKHAYLEGDKEATERKASAFSR